MIRPDGSAIRPRIPPIWRMLPLFPRAPESVIILTGLPSLSIVHHLVGHRLGDDLPQLDDLLVALVLGDEAALELLVDLPSTSSSAFLSSAPFCSGTTMSHRPMVMPPRVANLKPMLLDGVDQVGGLDGAEVAIAVDPLAP